MQFDESGVPLAAEPFTHTTGQAHWETLLRARAIENLCFVAAPAQGGLHENGRRTWGHSMLVDPWGVVLHDRAEGEGIDLAELVPSRTDCRGRRRDLTMVKGAAPCRSTMGHGIHGGRLRAPARYKPQQHPRSPPCGRKSTIRCTTRGCRR